MKSFEVFASTPQEKIEWIEALEKCKELVLQQIGIDDENVTVRAAWKNDASSKLCLQCHEQFTWIKRRHHCRHCGELVCGSCSPYQVATTKDSSKKERMCKLCHSDYESIRTGTPDDQTRSGQLPTIPSFVYYAKEEYEGKKQNTLETKTLAPIEDVIYRKKDFEKKYDPSLIKYVSV